MTNDANAIAIAIDIAIAIAIAIAITITIASPSESPSPSPLPLPQPPSSPLPSPSRSRFTEKSVTIGFGSANSPRRWWISPWIVLVGTGRCSAPWPWGGTVAAPKGFVPLGAVGNAPVGTSLCRCGDRFLGCAFPEWFLLPCQPGLVFGQVPPCS
ncbi:hypothetical protein OUZ56_015114 [Daphnia magna]|uniref:Uncharacterized protein n=1 Tax=Daphnia magna TaxID=35525 RepID=A0ABR0ALW1_9CRUS|nr:hypothetical protein OUZ56_015114 [Daphnia magna]